jgi:hypothetical protein
MQDTGRINPKPLNPNICDMGQGEALHMKYRRLKLGGGQAYDRSAD